MQTVVSISICTRLGNPIICRNYLGISQSRLESLLSSFPRSLSPGQQHSFVETREARFVFQPLEQFFLVLITSKASNLFQDLETLHLANRIILNTCSSLDETSFLEQSFELSFAFDEIVSCGYSENITLPQITSNLVMESQEEVLQELVEKVTFYYIINVLIVIIVIIILCLSVCRIKFKKLVRLENKR